MSKVGGVVGGWDDTRHDKCGICSNPIFQLVFVTKYLAYF